MPQYAAAAAGAVIISTAVLLPVFRKFKLLNVIMLLSAAFASLVLIAAFPLIFGLIGRIAGGREGTSGLMLVMALTTMLYLVLAFLFSMLAALLVAKINKGKLQDGSGSMEAAKTEAVNTEAADAEAAKTGASVAEAANRGVTDIKAANTEVQREAANAEIAVGGTASVNAAAPAAGENYLELIYNKLVRENAAEATDAVKTADAGEAENVGKAMSGGEKIIAGETVNNAESADKAENNLEKSVDSVENIDKMGIENILRNSMAMTIEECIDEAFRRKESGDAEGAIRYFMGALDKNPQKVLAFWIVLDICVLYKQLGRIDLAYDILNSYHDAFGNIMDDAVKEEIENNLIDIRA